MGLNGYPAGDNLEAVVPDLGAGKKQQPSEKEYVRIIFSKLPIWYYSNVPYLYHHGGVMKAIVDEDLCIGSGNCEDTCPTVFKVVDGISRVQVDVVPKEEEKNVQAAVDGCPAGAISTE